MEVQRNVYGPGDTTTHSVKVAEDAAHDAVSEIRDKLKQTFTEGSAHDNFDHIVQNVRQQVHQDVQQAEGVVEHIHDKAKQVEGAVENVIYDKTKRAPSPSTSRQAQEEEEGWQSDQEGESSNASVKAGRRQSRSPKLKPPKIAILKPAGKTRRRSIRRGMLDARVLGRTNPEDVAVSRHDKPLATNIEEVEPEEEDRGRRNSIRLPPVSSGIGPRHARIDSLRSMESRSRYSPREASPARSIRWADTDGGSMHDGAATHGRSSGYSTPGILSPTTPVSPLPQDEGQAEYESGADYIVSPANSTAVRFSVPPTPGARSP